MILNLEAFTAQEREIWTELETMLDRIERDPGAQLDLAHVCRLHYLYQRASADLARLATFAAQRELHRYVEHLVARAYGEIHKVRKRDSTFRPLIWLSQTFPRTFRKHLRAFHLSVAVTILGMLFGALALLFDPQAKAILMPFAHLQMTPTERVHMEENGKKDRFEGSRATFSTSLMTHNTKVSIFTVGLGASYGIGTFTSLFYNGVILGAVAADYISDGQTVFLLGWLLPHGSIEIPSILLAGQAGFILAGALIGWGTRQSLRRRLAAIVPDLTTLVFGIALLLVWAGLMESFLSQYHQPVIPYTAKIVFGIIELGLLIAYLGFSGAGSEERQAANAPAPKLARR